MKTYTISEVAKIMGVAPSALRYYDSEGLLPQIEKVNGRRVFTDEDLGRLKLIFCMKAIGTPIKEIRTFMDLVQQGDATLQQRLDIVLKQKSSLMEQLAVLEENLSLLSRKEEYYRKCVAAGTTDIDWQW